MYYNTSKAGAPVFPLGKGDKPCELCLSLEVTFCKGKEPALHDDRILSECGAFNIRLPSVLLPPFPKYFVE